MSLVVEAGDVIGVQGTGFVSDSIRSLTGHGPWSHVAAVVATQPFIMVIEALSPCVVVRSWEDRLADAPHLWIMKPPLTEDDRVDACRRLLKYDGHPYAYGNIADQLLDAMSGTEWFTEHWVSIKSTEVICSELIAIGEEKLGLRADDTTPNDIYGWGLTERWPIEQIK